MAATEQLEGLLEDVFTQAKTAMRQHYQAVRRLAVSDLPPERYFPQCLKHAVEIYAATAGAIWMRTNDAAGLRGAAAFAYDKLGLNGEYEQPHRDLLQFALSQTKSFVVRPNSSPASGAGASNPTDSFVVFGPLVHEGSAIGVIELFLGPRPIRGKTAAVRTGYTQFMEHLTPWVLQYLLRSLQRSAVAEATPPGYGQVASRIAGVRQEIAAHREALRRAVERVLQDFEGLRFSRAKESRDFVAEIHQLLEANGLRLACPQCGTPAILRCSSAGKSKTGLFVFDHYLENGRTFHGGSAALPRLQVVERPPRRRRQQS